MSQIALDPIGYSQALQDAGMPKAQADVIARAQEASVEKMAKQRELVTRHDLLETESRLRLEMATQKMDIIRWVVGSNIALAAFLVAILAWLK